MNRKGNVTDPGDRFYETSSSIRPFWEQVTLSNANEQTTTYKSLFSILRTMKDVRAHIASGTMAVPNQQLQYRADFRAIAEKLTPRIWEGPPWKNTLQPSQCDVWVAHQCNERRKRAAQAYCDHIHYFPHDQFRADLIALYDTLPRENTYYLIAQNKSSEYIAFMLYQHDPSIVDRLICLFPSNMESVSEWQHVANLLYTFKDAGIDDPVHFVFLDDISYSAGQSLVSLIELLRHIHHLAISFYPARLEKDIVELTLLSTYYTRKLQECFNFRVHMAFTYLTEKARDILTGERVYHPFRQERTIPIPFELTHHYPHVIPSLRKQVGDELFKDISAYFGYTSQYSEEEGGPDSIVYLDHKVADAVSTLGQPLLLGRTAPGGQNIRNYQTRHGFSWVPWQFERMKNDTGHCDHSIPIIPACQPHRTAIYDSFIPYDYPKSDTQCPLPWYKHLQRSTGRLFLPSVTNHHEIFPYSDYYPRLKVEGGKRQTKSANKRVKRRTRRAMHGKTRNRLVGTK